MMKKTVYVLSACTMLMAPFVTFSQPSKSLIDRKVIAEIRKFIETDIVRQSVLNQNEKYKSLSQQEIIAYDNKWRAERKSSDQPLISATLANPLSSYLTRIQAHSIGLYSEMFVMDKHGLNVGQSNISSDYWQGDEAKFQKTYPKGAQAVFIDDPEYDKDLKIWRVQVNMAVPNAAGNGAIGAATIEMNLTELERRMAKGESN